MAVVDVDIETIMQNLRTLQLADLRRIRAELDVLIREAKKEPQYTYRQEYTRCNKPSCSVCANGLGHGPYWFVYWRANGKKHRKYIGKEYQQLKPDVER